jgi:hypothetical protein
MTANETEPMQSPVVPNIYLSGPMPVRSLWCAVCVMLFMGEISSEQEFRDYARKLTDDAMAANALLVSIDLAERDNLQLQPSITIAPSWVLANAAPMPVCWTHVAGIPPEASPAGQAQRQVNYQSPLVPGKAYGTDQYRS